jgi:hypothetical protein
MDCPGPWRRDIHHFPLPAALANNNPEYGDLRIAGLEIVLHASKGAVGYSAHLLKHIPWISVYNGFLWI